MISNLGLIYLFIISIKSIFSICINKTSSIKNLSLFPTNDFPCMYSGLISINSTKDMNKKDEIFYVLVMSPENEEKNPLIIWINGEYSSMLGLFSEIGPLKLHNHSQNMYGTIKKNSLYQIANILFVDQPLGTGFSNTNEIGNIPTNQSQISKQFYNFLSSFLDENKEFLNRDIFLAGENYAGKYIPHLARNILLMNEKISKGQKLGKIINIKQVVIGNGLFSSEFQTPSRKTLLKGLNILSQDDEVHFEYITHNCLSLIGAKSTDAFGVCQKQIDFIQQISGRNIYDITLNDTMTFGIEMRKLIEYLNSKEVMVQLNLMRNVSDAKTKSFDLKNISVENAIKHNILLHSSKSSLEKIINDFNISVTIFAGLNDVVYGPKGIENFLESLNLKTSTKYINKQHELWIFSPNNNDQFIQPGYIKRYDDHLQFLTIKKSGYFVTMKQKHLIKSIFSKLINNQNLSNCDTKNGTYNCDLTKFKCEALRNCSGNGECGINTKGTCKCNDNFYGPDCNYNMSVISTTRTHINPNDLRLFSFTQNFDYYVDIETENQNSISIHLINKNDHIFLFNEDKHLMNIKNNYKISNHFFFRNDLVNDNLLVIKNLDHKNASHIKIYAYPYYSSHNFWGPGNGGFWLAIICFSIGLTLCFIAYTIFKKQQDSEKTNQYYLVSSQGTETVSSNSSNSNSHKNLNLKNEFRILPK